MQILGNQFAVPFNMNEQDDSVAGMEASFERLGLEIVGQGISPITKVPFVIVQTIIRDTIAAEMMARRVIAAYGVVH